MEIPPESYIESAYVESVDKSPDATLQRLLLALEHGDENQILSIYSERQHDPYLLKKHKRLLIQAKQRMRIISILKDAIRNDDDVTICRWYCPGLFDNSSLLKPKDRERIDLALKRLDVLQQLHNRDEEGERSTDNVLINDLTQSNLLTKFERECLVLDHLGPEPKEETLKNVDEINELHNSQVDQQLIEAWLQGDPLLDESDEQTENLKGIPQVYGYYLRVQQALERGDQEWLVQNCSDQSYSRWQLLPNKMKDEVNAAIKGIS